MKKATWCLLAALMLSAGCVVAPGIRGTSLDNKPVYTAYLKDKPLFALVTDGSSGSYGVSNAPFFGATYKGRIKNPKSGKTMEFRGTSGGKTLRLDGHSYDLAEGRLFLVSIKSDPFQVKQLQVSEEELQQPTMTDERIATFFQGS